MAFAEHATYLTIDQRDHKASLAPTVFWTTAVSNTFRVIGEMVSERPI
jgi:hypothetical protein